MTCCVALIQAKDTRDELETDTIYIPEPMPRKEDTGAPAEQ